MSAVVVIGAGLSALVAAAYLKRAGHTVAIIEEHSALDRASGWIPESVVRDLALGEHGFAVDPSEPLPVALTDAKRWPAFCEHMARLARFLETIYCAAPPDPMTQTSSGYARLGAFALRTRGLGRHTTEGLLRLLPMSAADFLDEWFETDALKGALGAAAVTNLAQGPRSGGTAFNLLHHHVGHAPGVFGVARSNAHEVLRRMLAPEIREGQIAKIEIRDGATTGVVLANGEAIPAVTVVSGGGPRRTLTELTDSAWLDPELVRAIRNIRARGVAARVTLALDLAPRFRTLRVAPSLDAIERAYDDWKYGGISKTPVLEARASERDGRHVVDVHVQYVPQDLPSAEHGAARAAIADRVLQGLTGELGANVVNTEVELPQDLERHHGYPQGQPYQAELGLDQMVWMRPLPQLAQYRTPIRGLYLCGSAMHPGIPAVAGANAAKIIARDLRRRA